MKPLEKIRSDIAASGAKIKALKQTPAPEKETRKAVESSVRNKAFEWREYVQRAGRSAASYQYGEEAVGHVYFGHALSMAAIFHFHEKEIVDEIMAEAAEIRASMQPAMSQAERESALDAELKKRYALELAEFEIMDSSPELPRPDANPFALLGLPLEVAGHPGITAILGD